MGADFVPILVMVNYFLFFSKYCFAIDNITSSQNLSREQTLISQGKTFELGFFSPNNSADHKYVGVWYKGISPQTVVWVANRENPLKATDSQASFEIGDDGNLRLVDGNQSLLWSTNVHVQSNTSVATLSDKGNLVLYNDGALTGALWRSFDNLSDTLLSGSAVGFNVKTGKTYVLTSWKSNSDPSVGNFTVEVSSQFKPVQVFIRINGSSPHWRSGPWARSTFIGIPEMDDSYQSPFGISDDADQGTTYFTFNSVSGSSMTQMLISSDGILKYMSKEEDSDWNVSWTSQKRSCDIYGICGPFGVCKASEYPICRCLKGFVPKSKEEWNKGTWTQGCGRGTDLICEKNTSSPSSTGGKKDGFQKVGNLKLPDLYEYLESADDLDACQTWCLDNCTCRAYAYVKGIGCLIWLQGLVDIQEFTDEGEDLFLRLAREELAGGQNNKKIIVSLATVSSVVTLVALLIGLHRWRAKQKRNIEDTMEKPFVQTRGDVISSTPFTTKQDPSELPMFDFNRILVATDYFSTGNKLGQGGFGPVYKGKLQDGTEIAVKRLSSSSGQGMEELKNEMILISKLQHRNLVKLLGCCIEKEERLLIYEFMLHKSLDNFIFDSRRRAQLSWTTRFNIINGVARGLVYLHRDSCLRVIHRDLKVSNILLDENMNPKISDFGLARIFEGTLDVANTRRVVGTLGYMSPEYAMGGIFSEKSDVFSFGVLLLEIVSGRKNTSFLYQDQHPSLIAYAWHQWSEGRELEMVDKELEDSYSSSEAMRCIHVGLLCVQDHVTDRLTMPDVIVMISKETDRPQPKQPLFIFQGLSGNEIQPQNDSNSVNEATTSIIEGR
ncbi:G-type lectin S-receptor-like serine/threonine-protein kinase At1g61490 [Morus notabilis]|uniref:G-type lectin S-receptor-like serine/threonine-protein kinase At1g61490 n=1 Tax=Morus notabilis TaxID=981085 RepID=UPI000CED4D43|nr:G-type lectin S-receptor-like serine/threonine-protein kinase At1g61490 [Morus notabilis]